MGLEAANRLAGDNANYFNAYRFIEPSLLGLADSYASYLRETGSSIFEIGLFTYFFIAKLIGANYQVAIAILNAWLALTLTLLLSHVCRSFASILLAGSLLATNYYVIVSFSELHKLALSICLLGSLAFLRAQPFVSIVLSPLFHTQALFFWPLRIRNVLAIKKVLFFSVVILLFIPLAMPIFAQKFSFYDINPAGTKASTVLLFMALLSQIALIIPSRLMWFVIACLPLVALSIVIGGGRLNFMLFVFYFSLFFRKAEKSGFTAFSFTVFSATSILILADGLLKTSDYMANSSLSYIIF